MDIKKGGGKRGKSKGDDTAAAAAAAESEGEMEVGAVPKNKKREKSKRDDAAAAPKGEMKVGAQKSENETQKRMKIWEPSTELTEDFLREEIGIHPRVSKEVFEKLKTRDVLTVGALVGSSREQLEGLMNISLGSANAIMDFIEQQKGKQNLQEMTHFCSEKIH